MNRLRFRLISFGQWRIRFIGSFTILHCVLCLSSVHVVNSILVVRVRVLERSCAICNAVRVMEKQPLIFQTRPEECSRHPSCTGVRVDQVVQYGYLDPSALLLRGRPQLRDEAVDTAQIRIDAQAGHLRDANVGGNRYAAKRFALGDIGEMDLDRRNANRR
jgi:hypothetical protein